jgi:hypothetical protein
MSDGRRAELPSFGRRFLAGEETMTSIGSGEIGGKATGLDLVRRKVLADLPSCCQDSFTIDVPRLVVLTTEVFDAFVTQNKLLDLPWDDLRDDRIAHTFLQADLPAQWLGDLRSLVEYVHQPLAVRSSSLLEDALDHPFAGVYGTKMIPNNQQDPNRRFKLLVQAVKFVYASTFFREARAYQRSVGVKVGEEKMAVIVQEIVGVRHDDRYYPHLSGVARSWNAYPTGRSCPEEGVVNLALGLGKQIVDGGLSWIYSPAWPDSPPPDAGPADRLRNSQTRFWAVNMGQPPLPDPIREAEYLVDADLGVAEHDGVLDHLVSTFDPGSDRLRPGLTGGGPRLLDFAPILQYDVLPLNALVRELLARGEAAADGPVEIEFAVTLAPSGGRARFGFLQMRPMRVVEEAVSITDDDLADPRALLVATRVLGNGQRDDIADIVYLRPEVFEARHTPAIAGELEAFDRRLAEAGRPYLLIGFGRWGSSDPWLGVPVSWSQIGAARVIVEATLPGMEPELSQGSHFFHNLISFRVLYLSIWHRAGQRIAWERLDALPAQHETDFVRHVRLVRPLDVRVDGRHGRGVVILHE